MSIDWSKAKEGYDFHINIFGRGAFYRLEGDRYVQPGGGYIAISDLPHHTAIITERPKPWSGEGLPPVGIECERMWASGPASYVKVRVIAHDDGQAIYRFLEDRRKGEVQADRDGDGDSCGNPIFRPIRTPEQIAAEEALLDIERLYSEGGPAAVFDAGYRKQEAK